MTAPATTRAMHATAHRNLALAAYDDLVRSISSYQMAGALSAEVAVELQRMAVAELEGQLAAWDEFADREKPSRLVRHRTPAGGLDHEAAHALYAVGGVEP